MKSPDTRDPGRPLPRPPRAVMFRIAAAAPEMLSEDVIVYHIIVLGSLYGSILLSIAESRSKHEKSGFHSNLTVGRGF